MKSSSLKAIEQAAADWLIRRQEGLTADEQRQFSAWLEGSPENRDALAKLEHTWKTLTSPRQAGQAEVALTELSRRSRRRQRRAIGFSVTALAAAAAVIIAFLPTRPLPVLPTGPVTALVHPDVRHLPDGSTVELNAGAEITWNFTATERDVHLVRGEALFSVAKDATHPFIVSAGEVKVRAVGTAFNVRLGASAVAVLVTEGKVRVNAPSTKVDEPAVLVAAGEGTTVELNRTGPLTALPVTPAQVQQALAWHSKRIEFTRAPLSEVVEIFNRESELKLTIGDPAIRTLQITGIYWADDAEGFIRLLNSGLDLKAERHGETFTLRGP